MPSKWYWVPALILWLTSTSWLLTTKILPTLNPGRPPDYAQLLPQIPVREPVPVRWSIRWNGSDIGWAENKISRRPDGTGQIVSEVQFRQLPVNELLGDVMGIVGRLITPWAEDLGQLDLRVLTKMEFDNYGALSRFTTNADVGELTELLQVEGHVAEDTLDLAARVQSGEDAPTEIYRNKEIALPPDALVADTFSPRPRLSSIRVGQTWTFQSYQPLMPHSPLTLIEAKVEQEELIEWNGTMVRARKVAFRKDAGSGISSTRRPVSETWVMHDGTVVRQDLWLANVKVQFVRMPEVTSPDASSLRVADIPQDRILAGEHD